MKPRRPASERWAELPDDDRRRARSQIQTMRNQWRDLFAFTARDRAVARALTTALAVLREAARGRR